MRKKLTICASEWTDSAHANVFVANHDTERVSTVSDVLSPVISNTFVQNGNALNANSPSNTYTNAMVFSLAHPYGTPTILSSYSDFTDYDAGAPNSGA